MECARGEPLYAGNQGEALQLEAPRAPALCTHPVLSSILPVNRVPRDSIYQQMHVVFGLVLPLSY